MRKYLVHIIISVLFANIASAQLRKTPQNLPRYDFKKMHFGFTLGINSLDFKIQHNPEVMYQDSLYILQSNNQKGFNLGIVSNFRLGQYTDFRFIPALVFGERHLIYSFADSLNTIHPIKKKVESTILDFPLYIKYKSERYNNFRSYVLLGIKYSIDIASQKNIVEEDEVIIKLGREFLHLETNATNIFMIKDNKVYTPFPKSCLPGITRQIVIDICKNNKIHIEERNISVTEMYNADEVFTTGTMGELSRVDSIDRRCIENNGNLLQKLEILFRELTKTKGERLPF